MSKLAWLILDFECQLGLGVGGEPGKRLAARLAMPLSADTLLRLVRAAVRPAQPPPRVVGVDEWAWRRGQNYGTLLVDLERHTVIDLLPDRETATVADWLKRHDGIEVVARDRAGAYAEAQARARDSRHRPSSATHQRTSRLPRLHTRTRRAGCFVLRFSVTSPVNRALHELS